MVESPLLCLRDGIRLQRSSEILPTTLVLANAQQRLQLHNATLGLTAMLEKLAGPGASSEECARLVAEADGANALHRLYSLQWRLEKLGWLCRLVHNGHGRRLAVAEPNLPGTIWSEHRADADATYTLSRFACCRPDGGALIIESALGNFTIRLLDWQGAALVCLLAKPHSGRELAQHIPDLDEGQALGFITLLLCAGLLYRADAQGLTCEDSDPVLVQWDYYDLLFHARSRGGRHSRLAGATFRFKGQIAPLPAVKIPVGRTSINLFRPCLEALQNTDPGLTRIIEARRSLRGYGADPMTASALGEFLFRTARVRKVWQTDSGELSTRPYPGAGACHPLEIYVLVTTCRDLEGGLYHYQPQEHRLYMVAGPSEVHCRLVEAARLSMGGGQAPQVLLVLAARFARLSWKYDALAYMLLLKEVGILYQTMYLVATAMNLAPCAVGNGDAALFAEALGTHWCEETSIGEFALGSRPPGASDWHKPDKM